MKGLNAKECSVRIWGARVSSWQCSKKATVEREGKYYCTIHDPVRVEKKEKERSAKYHEKDCRKCHTHIYYDFYRFCPHCGTKRAPNS